VLVSPTIYLEMYHVYGVTGKAFYVLDIHHELVGKKIYVEFLLQNSTIYYFYYFYTFSFRGQSLLDPLTRGCAPEPHWGKAPDPHYKLTLHARHDFAPPSLTV